MFRPILLLALSTAVLVAPQATPSSVQRQGGGAITGTIEGVIVQRGASSTTPEGKIAVGYRLVRGADVTSIDSTGVHARARTALFVHAFHRGTPPAELPVLTRAAEILAQGALANTASVEYLPGDLELFASYLLVPGNEVPERYPLAGTLAGDTTHRRVLPSLRIRAAAGATTLPVGDVAGPRP